mmetsp:Transcript_23767/g.50535  ORF Transcript_23767/g.50535 Transcript_23767/m.50535 type:complete len:131 (-) Transcript_23767:1236-1628(-)|eukprot:CAMPEP_0201117924 /NCGR_PEP_ID=MMETSP0850-20130426/1987_1 /ASSEMBLY_ACC=CAM_ASM_000622 /TAXON_ID=183588 /ORGANISM="Pseudo-nitzschia fraudulenta, Strain WWA7" /LENGTH=130 /DNA_ID=CAMNT_0047382697 /DNA_START=106 /DNA_END=498 /DNA_ORIENTATION=+
MMSRTPTLFLLFSAAAVFLSSVDAFTMRTGRAIEGAHRMQSKAALVSILKMSEGSEQEEAASKISADGTFYDDEIDTAPIKSGISDSMRAKLMAEASTGLDSEKPQTNVILYIGIVVAILVALGGSGILY